MNNVAINMVVQASLVCRLRFLQVCPGCLPRVWGVIYQSLWFLNLCPFRNSNENEITYTCTLAWRLPPARVVQGHKMEDHQLEIHIYDGFQSRTMKTLLTSMRRAEHLSNTEPSQWSHNCSLVHTSSSSTKDATIPCLVGSFPAQGDSPSWRSPWGQLSTMFGFP